ncbi:MAG: hypothetical protein ACTSRP_22400 [Candidatus Helarchaeota archaeon]
MADNFRKGGERLIRLLRSKYRLGILIPMDLLTSSESSRILIFLPSLGLRVLEESS